MDGRDIRGIPTPRFKPPDIPAKSVAVVVLVVVLLLAGFSGFYTIEPEEVGVVLRFGKYVRTRNRGCTSSSPGPIETMIKVPVQRQLKEEFGFRTVRAGVQSQYADAGLRRTSRNMLTGDLNAAVVEWVVQYRIVDPYKYLFQVRNVERDLPRHERGGHAQGRRRPHRQRGADRRPRRGGPGGRSTGLQELCDQYETGIKVEQVVLQDVNPPDPVQALVQRGQRGPAGEGEAHQPGPVRVQPGDPQGPGRGPADHPGGRGLRPGPGQPRPG